MPVPAPRVSVIERGVCAPLFPAKHRKPLPFEESGRRRGGVEGRKLRQREQRAKPNRRASARTPMSFAPRRRRIDRGASRRYRRSTCASAPRVGSSSRASRSQCSAIRHCRSEIPYWESRRDGRVKTGSADRNGTEKPRWNPAGAPARPRRPPAPPSSRVPESLMSEQMVVLAFVPGSVAQHAV
jgi:hypothetical protein